MTNTSDIKGNESLLGKQQSTIFLTNAIGDNYFFCISLNESDLLFESNSFILLLSYNNLLDTYTSRVLE